MDAGTASAVGSVAMTPPSAPVRRTASNEAVKGYQGSKAAAREPGGEDSVELSPQGRLMAERLRQASPGQEQGGTAATAERMANEAKDKIRIADEQQKVLDELRKKEEAALQGRTELTDYEKKRMARLDQIQLMIDQGRYQVDNFIVDRVAVDLAKLMV